MGKLYKENLGTFKFISKENKDYKWGNTILHIVSPKQRFQMR